MIIKHILNSSTDKCKVFYLTLQAQPKGHGAGAPPAGVPLSMREVEELERMTKDFIKDMDNRAPVITSAPTGHLTLLHTSISYSFIITNRRYQSTGDKQLTSPHLSHTVLNIVEIV